MIYDLRVLTVDIAITDLIVFVQNNQGSNHTWNPPKTSKNRNNKKRTTTSVDYSQRRKNNCQKYSK